MSRPRTPPVDDALITRWRAAWPEALAVWSRYTRLRDPRLCSTTVSAAREGLSGSFAMIRLLDQSVVIDLQAVRQYALEDFGIEILAHEIGHHVLAPATALDHFRLIARMRRALPTLEQHAAMVANLYTDLCINDRLQRQAGLRMETIYRKLAQAPAGPASRMWTLYMRIYEHLWQLAPGQLAGSGFADADALDTDAWLGARVIRVYGADWMRGAGRFATLVLPYLLNDQAAHEKLQAWHDTGAAAEGCLPDGMHAFDPDEDDDIVHPLDDPAVSGDDVGTSEPQPAATRSTGQAREPFEYGEILRAGGVVLSPHAIAMRYYRERALPHLVDFPRRPSPRAPEPEMEGLEPWELGASIERVDWLHSLALSPTPIPGFTIMQRRMTEEPAFEKRPVPVDLDLYVDSSGSMPNPQVSTSFPALAGAIVALSALRAGASVQVTLWSGKRDVMGTTGFVRDADQILHVLTGFFGGSTCFPIHRLRDTYPAQGQRQRMTHILMISDSGITTMFDRDERGNSGWDVAAAALRAAGGGGTMALDMPACWEDWAGASGDNPWGQLQRARDREGWAIHAVTDMGQLVDFARAFSNRHYGAQR